MPSQTTRLLALLGLLLALALFPACGDGGGGGGGGDGETRLTVVNTTQSGESADVEVDSVRIATLPAGQTRTMAVHPGPHDVAFYYAGTRLPLCLPARMNFPSGGTLTLTCDGTGLGQECAPPDAGGSRILVANASTVSYDVRINGQLRGSIPSRSSQVYGVSPGANTLDVEFAGTRMDACSPHTFNVGAGAICGLRCSNSNAPGIFEFRNGTSLGLDFYVDTRFVGRVSAGGSLDHVVTPGRYLIESRWAGTSTTACSPTFFSVSSGQRFVLNCQ